MGKAKKRNLHIRQNGLTTMSREQAVKEIISRIKSADFGPETKDVIGLFGISAEELSEAGATYEELKALGQIIL